MKITFDKMHGLGNDFMVIDATENKFVLSTKQIQQLADRHRGVGFDQMLVLTPSDDKAYDFRYRIFNNDGGEVEQCGNGARCIAKFIHDHQLSPKRELRIQTAKGSIVLHLATDGLITVDMGQPVFEPAEIPFLATANRELYKLQVAGQDLDIAVVSMGNPHAIIQVPNIEKAPVTELGSQIEIHERFPKRVNVEFVEILNRHEINLRVFERGTGETEACGSGACAAVAALRRLDLVDSEVTVHLLGGDLIIRWRGEGDSVQMIGPAVTVYRGVVEI